jgi:hypothetical protein
MEKQTAVEWLIEQIEGTDFKIARAIGLKKYNQIVQQAKAMEKEQMHKCASFWRGKENEIEKPIFNLYYNETYNK